MPKYRRYQRYTKEEKQRVGLYMTKEFHSKLDKEALKEGRSLNAFVIKILEDYFKEEEEQ